MTYYFMSYERLINKKYLNIKKIISVGIKTFFFVFLIFINTLTIFFHFFENNPQKFFLFFTETFILKTINKFPS